MPEAAKYRVIGKRIPKVDGAEKVTGQSKFGADIMLPRMLHGKVLRSPYAHARIIRINSRRAEDLPGVVAVITGRDLPAVPTGANTSRGMVTTREHYLADEVMARDKVLFHGHAVAAVAARSPHVAEEALSLVEVEYEVLPHVLDPAEAMKADAPLLHDDLFTKRQSLIAKTPSNIAEHLEYSRGDVQRGFAEADVVVERTFKTQTVHQGYIEPDSETAQVYPDGSVTVWANSQAIYRQKYDLSILLDIPQTKIKVIPTEIGGAFGGKESVRISALCVALSQRAGLPVKISLTREEVLRATGPGSAIVANIKAGARRDGTITAIQAHLIYDAGAYPGAPLRSAVRRVFSIYRTPNLKIDAFDVVTNRPHVAAYRAPGATPTNFALESVVDEIGEALEMDPIEFRLKNVSRPGDPMPDGVILPSVNLVEVLNRVKEHPCWTTPLAKADQGRGIALGLWTMPGGTTSCHIILNRDASVTLALGTVDLSGTRTSLAMVAAEALGLDMSDIRVVVGDTDMVAHTDPSAGDRVTYITSKAVNQASQDLLEQLKRRVAGEFKVPVEEVTYHRKLFRVRGPSELGMTLEELALRSISDAGAVMGHGSVSATFTDVAIAPNAAAHVVDVQVDRETGKVDVLRLTTFQDVGAAVSPGQVEGQMQGGATQGVGWALWEEYDFDDKGMLRNASLLDYRMPTCLDMPLIGACIQEVPSGDHPYGIRSVGQVPIVPPAAAIANAIHRATGLRIKELPMKPERVYWELAKVLAQK